MDYTNFYYDNYCSIVDNEKDVEITRATIDYLIDNNKSEKEILAILKDCSGKARITHEDLPDYVWNGLTQRGKFYYHHLLQITPEAKFDTKTCKEISTPFYLEMKCSFSYEDLIKYFMRQLNIDQELYDKKRFEGQFSSLLKQIHFSFIEPLDFVLSLIDNAKRKDDFLVFEPFNLTDHGNINEVFTQLKRVVAQSNALGTNREILRCGLADT